MTEKYDEVYYEDGIKNRVSGYENYKWMPERSIREATSLIQKTEFQNVVDFGCAKGFLVHAFRLLGKDAHGLDISDYALRHCHPDVKNYVHSLKSKSLSDFQGSDLLIAKDVLEHLTVDELDEILPQAKQHFKQIFVAVPLGDGKRYRIREYEMDVTHIIRQTEDWWLAKLTSHGFKVNYFDYKFGYIKDHWYGVEKFGNCFILAN